MGTLQFCAGKEDLNQRFHLHTKVIVCILRLPYVQITQIGNTLLQTVVFLGQVEFTVRFVTCWFVVRRRTVLLLTVKT